ITSFTTDRALLRGALESLGKSRVFLAADPLLLAAAPSQAAGGGTSERRSEVEAAAAEVGEDIDRQTQKMDDAWRRGRVERQLAGLGGIARVLDRLPGRKQVILLSEGFDARFLHGSENVASSREAAEASISGEIWKIDNEQRFGSTQATAKLEAMGELFRRSDVVLHAMDIQGLRTDVSAREGRRENSNESLFLLANGTGGQVFKNANDVSASFDSLIQQQQVTYVLGFQTTGSGDPNRFHELRVRLKDSERGTRVVHRPGFYDARDEPGGIERALSAATILMNDIPRDEIRVEPMAVPFKASSGDAVVPVILEIDGRSILEGAPGKSALDGELFVYAFDGEGAVRDFLFQKIGLDLTKVAESLRAAGLKYYGALNLPPGRYAIKSLFRAGGRDGFARVDVEVPDFAMPVALPPIAMSAENRWILVKSSPRRPAETPYPFTVASDSFIPEPVADMKDGVSRQVALFTYNVSAEGLEVGAKVRGSDGADHPAAIEILGRSPAGETRHAKVLVRFTPKGLPPGAYSLEFDLKDGSGRLAQSVAMPFTIVSGS
ncbi:MAG TPA: VWA domain-containing protein, partial [Thermoanaerobaculia bacterium]